MKRYLLIILLSLCFIGCKTTKYNVKETYKENRETVIDVREEKKENTVTKAEIALNEDLIIEEVIVRYFPPDSTGKQHISETVNRSIGNKKTEITNIVSETEKSDVTELKVVEKTDIEAEKIDKTVVKTSTPNVIFWAIIIPVIAIVVAGFLVLKKYKLI